jgi:hypothetical protein
MAKPDIVIVDGPAFSWQRLCELRRRRQLEARQAAHEAEIVDLHVEAPTVAVDPRSAYRLPETAFTVLGHGVNPVARAVVCLAHVIFLSSWFESHAPCATSWGTKARAEQRRVQRRPAGHREAARSWQGAEGD